MGNVIQYEKRAGEASYFPGPGFSSLAAVWMTGTPVPIYKPRLYRRDTLGLAATQQQQTSAGDGEHGKRSRFGHVG